MTQSGHARRFGMSRWLRLSCAIGLLGASLGCRSRPAAKDTPPLSTDAAVRPAQPLAFRVMTTAQGDPKDPLPWVIALHGLGDSPDGFRSLFVNLPRAAHVYLVQAPTPYGNGYDWFAGKTWAKPEILGQAVRGAADQIVDLVRHLAASPENQGLPVVTGFSQGGYLSFALAAMYPESFGAALPIAGSLPTPAWPQRSAPGFRVIAFHGTADQLVPLGPTRSLVERFKKHGYAVTLLEYPGVAHTIQQKEFSDWQLALLEVLAAQDPAEARTR